jgi:hypothetical protein
MYFALKRIAMWTVLLLSCPSIATAQQFRVKRNVNLRADPSTTTAPIELLQAGVELTLIISSWSGQ